MAIIYTIDLIITSIFLFILSKNFIYLLKLKKEENLLWDKYEETKDWFLTGNYELNFKKFRKHYSYQLEKVKKISGCLIIYSIVKFAFYAIIKII